MKRSKHSRAGHIPLRTCAGCRQVREKQTLLRVVRATNGVVSVDLSGRAPGRGVYVCPDPSCVSMAKKRHALERSLRCPVPEQVYEDLTRVVVSRDAPQ
ncbi:MAG: YlxR family protein [candidate division KSB1 bacterium]|nr:YlxR family protein [candidate division KSB1 bacterium]MDZ7413649.1 YlxR family protein [candidate division KSB1 bacterium]